MAYHTNTVLKLESILQTSACGACVASLAVFKTVAVTGTL